jgi:hypothetical protein
MTKMVNPLPFVIVGDKVFALSHVLRPYPSTNSDISARAHTHTHTHKNIYVCIYIHTYIHTYIHIYRKLQINLSKKNGGACIWHTGTTVPFTHTPQYPTAMCQTRASPHAICRGGSGTRYCTSSSHKISLFLISVIHQNTHPNITR